MKRWLKVLILGLGSVLILYALLIGGAVLLERRMIYHPTAVRTEPEPGGPPIQVVEIDTADGEQLVAWWLPPTKDQPVLLFFNGNSDSLSLQQGRWRRISDAGVGFLAIGYRGYNGSTGRPSEKGLREDALAAYAWLNRRYPVSQIVIHGFSLGSGVAVTLASEKPARAVVLEAPYTGISDIAAKMYPYVPVRLFMRDQFLSRERIAKVHAPLLIIHGDRDSVVPFSQGQELFSLANQPKTFVRMEGSQHNTLTRDGLYDHIWRFIGVPLKGTTAYQGKPVKADITTEG